MRISETKGASYFKEKNKSHEWTRMASKREGFLTCPRWTPEGSGRLESEEAPGGGLGGFSLFSVERNSFSESTVGLVPKGRWKLAGGKAAPAVAAPGQAKPPNQVLEGRRNPAQSEPSSAPPGRDSTWDRVSGGGADSLPPANFRGSSGASHALSAYFIPPKTARNRLGRR